MRGWRRWCHGSYSQPTSSWTEQLRRIDVKSHHKVSCSFHRAPNTQVKDRSQVKQIQFRFSSKMNPLKLKNVVSLSPCPQKYTGLFIWGASLTFQCFKNVYHFYIKYQLDKRLFFFFLIKNKMNAFEVLVTSSAQKGCLVGLALPGECWGRHFGKREITTYILSPNQLGGRRKTSTFRYYRQR